MAFANSSQSPESDRVPRGIVGWLISKVGVNLLTVLAVLPVLLVLGIIFKGKDISSYYHSRGATSIADEAMVLIEGGRWESASTLLQNAVRKHPDQPPLLRAVAELFVRGYNDPTSAVTFLRRVVVKPEATKADTLRLAEVLLLSGDTAESQRLYDELPAPEREGRKGLELLSRIRRAMGKSIEADAILRRALMVDPNDAEAKLQLAIMDEAAALADAKASANEVIWRIAAGKDDVAMRALEHLANADSTPAARAHQLKQLMEEHPTMTDSLRYFVLRRFCRLLPLEQPKLVLKETERTKGRQTKERFDFLRWLGLLGEYDRVLDLVPADSLTGDADVFLIYVDALSAANRWKELLNLMQTRKVPITAATAHIILATCFSKLQPDLRESRRQLSLGIDRGRSELPVMLRAAQLAEALNFFDLAIKAYKIVAESRPSMRQSLLEKVLLLQRGDKDAPGMIATLKHLRDLRPRNRAYADDLNYLRLVTGLELELAYSDVIGYSDEPTGPASAPTIPPALLRALAGLRMGERERVMSEITALPTPEGQPPGQRAIIACLYTLSGRDIEGFRLGEKVPSTTLLPDELSFLRRAMQ